MVKIHDINKISGALADFDFGNLRGRVRLCIETYASHPSWILQEDYFVEFAGNESLAAVYDRGDWRECIKRFVSEFEKTFSPQFESVFQEFWIHKVSIDYYTNDNHPSIYPPSYPTGPVVCSLYFCRRRNAWIIDHEAGSYPFYIGPPYISKLFRSSIDVVDFVHLTSILAPSFFSTTEE